MAEPTQSPINCGKPNEALSKLIASRLMHDEPDLYNFWRAFRLTNAHVEQIMGNSAAEGNTYKNISHAACQWLRENQEEWRAWPKNSVTTCQSGEQTVHDARTGLMSCIQCRAGTFNLDEHDGQRVCNPCPAGVICSGGNQLHTRASYWADPECKSEPCVRYKCHHQAACMTIPLSTCPALCSCPC